MAEVTSRSARCGTGVADEPDLWCNRAIMMTVKTASGRKAIVHSKGEAQRKIENAGGVEALEKAIGNGESLTGYGRKLGVDIVTLMQWVNADHGRSSRIREARRLAAVYWDERADEVIEQAGDQLSLDKAKQLAHHYRWRAKCIAPKEYGDRVQQEHTGADGGPIQTETKVTAQKVADELLKGMELQRQLKKAKSK